MPGCPVLSMRGWPTGGQPSGLTCGQPNSSTPCAEDRLWNFHRDAKFLHKFPASRHDWVWTQPDYFQHEIKITGKRARITDLNCVHPKWPLIFRKILQKLWRMRESETERAREDRQDGRTDRQTERTNKYKEARIKIIQTKTAENEKKNMHILCWHCFCSVCLFSR